jgi:uncharacterized lipoprotein YddW (UPF0748 family)
VRGQADTLYPSDLEPWSEMIPASARGFDPVAHALGEARRNGLQFHAWLNLMVAWQSKTRALPRDPAHPFFRWANPRDPSRARGVIYQTPGKPMTWGEADYVWLTPGNPEIEVTVRRVVMDFLARYPVDGLHWDDRTALPHGASYDPVSLERFRGRGNPMRLAGFADWHRDQLSRLLSNIYVQATAARPNLLVTASPFGIADKNRLPGYDKFKDAVHDFGSDAERWMQAGIVDALMPQIYWAEGDPDPNYGALVRDWLRANRSGRPIWPGSALGNYGGTQPLVPVQQRYVALARALGAGGNTFFSYTAAKDADWAGASKSLYPTRARVPRPAHKARPATGQVMGEVRGPGGRPVLDAWIRVKGRDYVYLSAADGFFGIPDLGPGRHEITVESSSGGARRSVVQVAAGRTTRIDFRFE